MPKFMLVYRDAVTVSQPSPEEMQAALKLWGDWIGKFMSTGEIVDAGDGLLPAGKIVRPGGIVSDGPYMESKEIVGGYSILSVATEERAIEIAKECPATIHGGSVEIRQLAGYA